MAFCIFEICVGLFWPSMMKMRAAHVPEEMRSTIMNFFRIPLNIFVCMVLYNVSLSADCACKTCQHMCCTVSPVTSILGCFIYLQVHSLAEAYSCTEANVFSKIFLHLTF